MEYFSLPSTELDLLDVTMELVINKFMLYNELAVIKKLAEI